MQLLRCVGVGEPETSGADLGFSSVTLHDCCLCTVIGPITVMLICQFRPLVDLRSAHFQNRIGNFFYKNIVIVAVLFWFQIYCLWSTT
jgi:hypothetical protein